MSSERLRKGKEKTTELQAAHNVGEATERLQQRERDEQSSTLGLSSWLRAPRRNDRRSLLRRLAGLGRIGRCALGGRIGDGRGCALGWRIGHGRSGDLGRWIGDALGRWVGNALGRRIGSLRRWIGIRRATGGRPRVAVAAAGIGRVLVAARGSARLRRTRR